MKILEAQPPSAHDTLVATLIQTGDWYQIKHQPERALPYYRRAAALSATLAGSRGTARGTHCDSSNTSPRR